MYYIENSKNAKRINLEKVIDYEPVNSQNDNFSIQFNLDKRYIVWDFDSKEERDKVLYNLDNNVRESV